jgi:hypothetical protein
MTQQERFLPAMGFKEPGDSTRISQKDEWLEFSSGKNIRAICLIVSLVSNRLASKTKSDGESVNSLSYRKAQNFDSHSLHPFGPGYYINIHSN